MYVFLRVRLRFAAGISGRTGITMADIEKDHGLFRQFQCVCPSQLMFNGMLLRRR